MKAGEYSAAGGSLLLSFGLPSVVSVDRFLYLPQDRAPCARLGEAARTVDMHSSAGARRTATRIVFAARWVAGDKLVSDQLCENLWVQRLCERTCEAQRTMSESSTVARQGRGVVSAEKASQSQLMVWQAVGSLVASAARVCLDIPAKSQSMIFAELVMEANCLMGAYIPR